MKIIDKKVLRMEYRRGDRTVAEGTARIGINRVDRNDKGIELVTESRIERD